jgi:hypothetical protein
MKRPMECCNRTGSVDEPVRFHPVAGVTRAGEPRRVGSVRPFFGDERLQDRAPWGIRVGTASTKQRLRPMWRLCPAPGSAM